MKNLENIEINKNIVIVKICGMEQVCGYIGNILIERKVMFKKISGVDPYVHLFRPKHSTTTNSVLKFILIIEKIIPVRIIFSNNSATDFNNRQLGAYTWAEKGTKWNFPSK